MIRRRFVARGIVQGVGFRPFVHRLASELALAGWVRNDGRGVTIEAQGPAVTLDAFACRLHAELPAAAALDALDVTTVAVEHEPGAFAIRPSATDAGVDEAAIGPDRAVCPECLAELFDPQDRRYRYPFINCTACGPRYTIARALPYDRSRTSMAAFEQCPACHTEYTTPSHRRFHAEPNACQVCGPRLRLVDGDGREMTGDAVAGAIDCIARGGIVAIKGLGGFHLACDARQPRAVARLRERKQREEKPFALMAANAVSLAPWVELDAEAEEDLAQPARPIVLLRKRADADEAFAGVAPGLAWLGAMLPYTPLHYLLFFEAAGRPAGTAWLTEPQSLVLVMTSANHHSEPLVTDNDEALCALSSIADLFLLHDRDIVVRCDDSVLRRLPGAAPQFLRRARGYTPRALSLGRDTESVLALGGFYNNAPCVTRGANAFLAQHIGDLDRVANCRALETASHHLLDLLDVHPRAVAHDLHPDFFSTQLAQRLAEEWRVPSVAVQHHHAHIAAVLAEHRIEGPVLGLALDGVGLGEGGTLWGGELLRVDGAHAERIGHLRKLPLPGGDAAAREPWRMGAAALALLGREDEIAARYAALAPAAQLAQIIARSPETSSMGRWFDAVAGLLGVCSRMTFEGQAAMALEGLADAHGEVALRAPLHRLVRDSALTVLDLAPALAVLADESEPARGAAIFHAVLIEALADWIDDAAARERMSTVACGGGCMINVILACGLRRALARRGIVMLEAALAPPGDGGLALGQAWVAQRSL